MYKLTLSSSIIRISDGACIPADPENTDYKYYLLWVSEGNTPQPADNSVKTKAQLKAEELLTLAASYKATITTLQLNWLTASVNDGVTEVDKKSQVVTDIAAAKAQYLSDVAAIKLKYA